jgi:flagellar basal-body rod modification protein FlgD
MSRIPNDTTVVRQTPTTGSGNGLSNVDADKFLELLLAELQNQDPLNPMDNSEMLQQINQIREIGATSELTDTLGAVLLGQNVATASSLIGKRISALTDDAKNVEGIVDRVSMEKDDTNDSRPTLRVHIGDHRIDMSNIREIVEQV